MKKGSPPPKSNVNSAGAIEIDKNNKNEPPKTVQTNVGIPNGKTRKVIIWVILISVLTVFYWLVFFHHVLEETFTDRLQHSDFDYIVTTAQSRNESDVALPSKNISNGKIEIVRNDTSKSLQTKMIPMIKFESTSQVQKYAAEFTASQAIDSGVTDNSGGNEDSIDFFEISNNLTSGSARRCFPHNSEKWLAAGGKRFGNTNDSYVNDDFVYENIINAGNLLNNQAHTKKLLDQTLCLPKSRFLSFDTTTTEVINPSNETIHFWSMRLIFLAAHLHQHLPARAEAEVRMRESCQSEMEALRIGNFDYECPGKKFLIVPLNEKGLGAVMRLGAVNALIAGIASNRTVVFVNNSPTGLKPVRRPWLHASCSRKDAQCFFMPITPCVLTTDDIKYAPLLERGEARELFKTGNVPAIYSKKKAVIVNIILRPQKTPETFRDNVVDIVNNFLIGPLVEKSPTDPRISLLKTASEFILEEEIARGESYYYFGHNVRHNHALVFYVMRPNEYYAEKLEEVMAHTFPKTFDPELALGLPIRASDKCFVESECLSFGEYMGLMDYTWKRHKDELLGTHSIPGIVGVNNLSASIIVTSEAPSIHEAQREFQRQGLHKNLSFQFDFVNNGFDLHQGSGSPKHLTSQNLNMTLDEIMLSSISTLKVQLNARYTVGNCCSNFHLLLFDFLKGGCGSNHNQIAECLQDNELPEFRLCCGWSKTEECLAKHNNTG